MSTKLIMGTHHDKWEPETCQTIGQLEGGRTEQTVAHVFGVSQSIISRILSSFLETGNAR